MTRWPPGFACAATITVHFDAETLWTSRDSANSTRPVTLSQGTFGAKRGVEAILDLLEEVELQSTFFVPGLVAETHPGVVRDIVSHGHEVGHHGYAHERFHGASVGDESDFLQRGMDALLSVLPDRPRGYCAPGWEITSNTFQLLAEFGFEYSTNMMDDVFPYVHPPSLGNRPGLVELPVHWSLDDAPFRLVGGSSDGPMISGKQMYELWMDEFEGIHEVGGLFNLTIHPQISGRPAMIRALRRLITAMQGYGDVWFAPCGAICDHVLSIENDGSREG